MTPQRLFLVAAVCFIAVGVMSAAETGVGARIFKRSHSSVRGCSSRRCYGLPSQRQPLLLSNRRTVLPKRPDLPRRVELCRTDEQRTFIRVMHVIFGMSANRRSVPPCTAGL
jgi:hypothetical protein